MSDTPRSGGPVADEFIADLAAASRILAERGVVDAFGHISHRHPEAPDRYFMARAMAPALVTPDDLIEYSRTASPATRTASACCCTRAHRLEAVVRHRAHRNR